MNATTSPTRNISIAFLAAALVGGLGCAKMSWKPAEMFSLNNTWPFHDESEPQEGTPTRMVGTWTDTVMSQPGKKSQRGFGGRIMFYEKDEKKPILVEGQLVVYAFDETDRDPTDNKPTRRYVFPADQMSLHMSKNEFGASYSFFLPWDEAGGPKTEVSLICRFEPKGGAVISSEQTRHLLPGTLVAVGTKQPPKVPEGVPMKPAVPTLQDLQAQRNEQRGAQLASYEAAANAPQLAATAIYTPQNVDAEQSRRMVATTINLPGGFQMPSSAGVATEGVGTTATALSASRLMTPGLPGQATPAMQPTMPIVPVGALPTAAFPQAMNVPTVGGPIAPNTPAYPPPTMLPAWNAQNAAVPGTQTMMSAPTNYGALPNAQLPLQQQQAAAPMMQQQLLQQQLMQQQALQRHMLPTPTPLAPGAGQLPVQSGGTAAASYPAAGRYLR